MHTTTTMQQVTVVCPYCEAPAVLRPTSAHLYGGRDFGPVWDCRPCDAYVGVNRQTGMPHGSLADKDLRLWRQRAHAAFDVVWKTDRVLTRRTAYCRLAALLQIPEASTHIGMFNIEQCKQVVQICSVPEWYVCHWP